MKPIHAIAHGSTEPVPAGLGARRLRLATEMAPGGLWAPVAPPAGAPTTSTVLHARCPELPPELESAILEALVRPLQPGETHRAGNDARERELYALLVALTPIQAMALRRRLERDRDDDPLAVALRRLVIERRNRVRAFLAGARRRAA